MNAALEQGMVDGKYKQVAPNRGGVIEGKLLVRGREDLHDIWYGMHEKDGKALPDSTYAKTTPNYFETAEPEPDV
jgi:hypothetical protein